MSIDPVTNPELFSTESREGLLIGVATFLMSTAAMAVALRFYTRKVMIRQLGIDDWLSAVALFFILATGITQCYMTRQGLGRHIGTLSQPDGFKNFMQNFYVAIVFYCTSGMFVKLTFLVQYYRVLATPRMRKLCIAAMIIIGSWSFSQLLIAIFLCVPIAGFWDKSIEARCLPTLGEWYQNAAGNIITDVAIFLLPLPSLGNLKLPRTQKFVLIGIFCLGFFTCAVSIIRIKYLQFYTDVTWENTDASIWSLCELCSGIVCSCLPCLRPLASQWFPALSTRSGVFGTSYRRPLGSQSRRSQFLTDPERGNDKPPRVSLTNSDNALIHDQEDYTLHPSISGEGSDSRVIELQTSREEIINNAAGPKLQIPKPVQTRRSADWEKPTVRTRIESSAGLYTELEMRYSGPAIQVQHDIVVHNSPASIDSDSE